MIARFCVSLGEASKVVSSWLVDYADMEASLMVVDGIYEEKRYYADLYVNYKEDVDVNYHQLIRVWV